ncbi:MAG: regulator, partial [Candidatus Kapaibacterium sp.]
GQMIFAGTYLAGAWSSTNSGLSWSPAGLNSKNVLSMTSIENNIFAGVENHPLYTGGIRHTTNYGQNWG